MAAEQDRSFGGKVAFVTGAANSIGRATALAFAREGASVVAADFSDQGNQETARMIEEAGGQALAVSCDVSMSPPSMVWSVSPNRRPSTTHSRTSASTPCVPE